MVPVRGGSNEYPQSMFWAEIRKKNLSIFIWKCSVFGGEFLYIFEKACFRNMSFKHYWLDSTWSQTWKKCLYLASRHRKKKNKKKKKTHARTHAQNGTEILFRLYQASQRIHTVWLEPSLHNYMISWVLEYMSEQGRSWSDCASAQSDLGRHYSHKA